MDIPTPPQAVAALAAFVRDRLADVSDTLSPLRKGREQRTELIAADKSVVAAARQFATAVVGAAAPFAATSYSRARLIRQMHASGLLTDDQLRATVAALDAGEVQHQ
jgi:hypothetical protein